MDTAVDANPVEAAARTYCEALHTGDGDAIARLCHDSFLMTCVGPDGRPQFLDKAAFVARVGGRDGLPGVPSYGVMAVDRAGDDIGHVKLWVDLPPRRYEDYLGFFRVGGEWKLITKLFRTADGPAFEV